MKILKSWSLLLLLVVALPMMTSCSKDGDDDKPINMTDAVGTWMCIESTDTYRGNTHTGLLVGTEVTIKSNGTYTSTASSSSSIMGKSGTYTLSGNTITAKNTEGYTFVITASINGNKMRWKGTASNGVNFSYLFQRE